MELSSVIYASLDGMGVRGRMDTCICMAESLHCSPETTTTLLIGLSQNKKKYLKLKKKMSCILNGTLLLLLSRLSHVQLCATP